MTPRRVAAIIPFYQKDEGILRKAVQSVLDQALPAGVSVHVFIIDDSSPMPPDADLAGLPVRPDIGISVHHQPNGGPGSARNLGLDLAGSDDFQFVAFLDSDDVWLPSHLADAIEALDQGYDFYFCDNGRAGSHDSYNEFVPILQERGAKLRDRAVELSPDGPVLGFKPHALAADMIKACLCHTSAIVCRMETIAGHRFDIEQRVAGEDHFLWISLAIAGSAIAISWRPNVQCGRGVNIFYSAFDWNAPATLVRVGNLLLMSQKLRAWPAAMALGRQDIEKMVRENRRAFSFLFLRTILKGRRPPLDTFRSVRRYDPWLPLRLPINFTRVLVDRSPDGRKF